MQNYSYSNWFHTLPEKADSSVTDCLKAASIETPLGIMIAVGNNAELYLLQFADKADLDSEIKQLMQETKLLIVKGMTPSILSIKNELNLYFKGQLKTFTTPLIFLGTPFQQKAWQALRQIPYGITKSYQEQAADIGKPSAYRAVGNANGANPFCIVVPCHRIIANDGKPGGYSSGLHRKTGYSSMKPKIIKDDEFIQPLFLPIEDSLTMGRELIQFEMGSWNKASGESLISANNDAEAISSFLQEFRDSPLTLQSYAKEIERLLLWCIHVAKISISSLRRDHLVEYQKFLQNPQPQKNGVAQKFQED